MGSHNVIPGHNINGLCDVKASNDCQPQLRVSKAQYLHGAFCLHGCVDKMQRVVVVRMNK
jgi:hypothetical protein